MQTFGQSVTVTMTNNCLLKDAYAMMYHAFTHDALFSTKGNTTCSCYYTVMAFLAAAATGVRAVYAALGVGAAVYKTYVSAYNYECHYNFS